MTGLPISLPPIDAAFAARLVRAEVAEAVAADIEARRNPDPLRRRFLDETMATASRIAINAAQAVA